MLDPQDSNIIPSPTPKTALTLNPWVNLWNTYTPVLDPCVQFNVSCPVRPYVNSECYHPTSVGIALRKVARSLVKVAEQHDVHNCEELDLSCNEGWLVVNTQDNPCREYPCQGNARRENKKRASG